MVISRSFSIAVVSAVSAVFYTRLLRPIQVQADLSKSPSVKSEEPLCVRLLQELELKSERLCQVYQEIPQAPFYRPPNYNIRALFAHQVGVLLYPNKNTFMNYIPHLPVAPPPILRRSTQQDLDSIQEFPVNFVTLPVPFEEDFQPYAFRTDRHLTKEILEFANHYNKTFDEFSKEPNNEKIKLRVAIFEVLVGLFTGVDSYNAVMYAIHFAQAASMAMLGVISQKWCSSKNFIQGPVFSRDFSQLPNCVGHVFYNSYQNAENQALLMFMGKSFQEDNSIIDPELYSHLNYLNYKK